MNESLEKRVRLALSAMALSAAEEIDHLARNRPVIRVILNKPTPTSTFANFLDAKINEIESGKVYSDSISLFNALSPQEQKEYQISSEFADKLKIMYYDLKNLNSISGKKLQYLREYLIEVSKKF